MAWIGVDESRDGPKLRRLYNLLNCSKFEASGILDFLWTWGLHNADITGRLIDIDREDIARYLYGAGAKCKLDMVQVVDALIATHWLDETPDGIFIHDWEEWQEPWYKVLRRREQDRERKRKNKEATMQEELQQEAPTKEAEAVSDEPVTEPKVLAEERPPTDKAQEQTMQPTQDVKAKKEPPKIKFADNVRMTDEEHRKLVDRYGERFTAACIETLNNYKGANGKMYKSDYLAILNWVVERVSEKRPGLMRASTVELDDGGNPFANYGYGGQ